MIQEDKELQCSACGSCLQQSFRFPGVDGKLNPPGRCYECINPNCYLFRRKAVLVESAKDESAKGR